MSVAPPSECRPLHAEYHIFASSPFPSSHILNQPPEQPHPQHTSHRTIRVFTPYRNLPQFDPQTEGWILVSLQ